jgi:hypothetical protein
VIRLVSRAQRWWQNVRRQPAAPVAFEVACACGEVARGQRQARHQELRCARCTQPVFVLPYSPLRPVADDGTSAAGGPSSLLQSRPWLLPVAAAVVTLALVVLAFVYFLPRIMSPREATPATAPEDLRPLVEAGKTALAEGNFQAAANSLVKARRLREAHPDLLTAAEARQLNQLARQADLLADLLTVPLQEILALAASSRNDEEWQALFDRRFRHAAVVFDAEVQRDAGQYRLDYLLRAPNEPARVELNDLKLLPLLPLDQPRRLLFGARLASVGREAQGVWVVRFAPDSGVLLTDLDTAAACCCQPLDEELRAVVRRQEEWVKELP